MARETPWSNWDEWVYVKELLFSFDKSERQMHGVDFVQTWKSRLRNGALPVSIELTATLVAANLEIAKSDQNEYQVKLAAGMALVRFVSGITDQLQTGLYAQSVQVVAEKIGIPDWMVELRHEIAHAQLPSLTAITSGVMFALNWLYYNYWEDTLKKVEEQKISKQSKFMENIRKYESVIETIWPQCNKNEAADFKKPKDNNQELTGIARNILKLLSQDNLTILAGIIVNSQFLVLNVNTLLNLNFPTNVDSELNEENISCICKLASLWHPLLNTIHEKYKAFTSVLIESMMNNLKGKSKVCITLALYMILNIQPDSYLNVAISLLQTPSPLSFQILEELLKQDLMGKADTAFLSDILLSFKAVGCTLSKTKPSNFCSWQSQIGKKDIGKKFSGLIVTINEVDSKKFSHMENRNSKWRLLSESETTSLPPIGVLPKGCTFHDMHSKKRILKVLNVTSMDCKSNEIVNTKKNKEYFNERLDGVIDALFVDCKDTKDNSSFFATEEKYEDDQEMASDDVNSHPLTVEEKYTILSPKLEASSLDVSKIAFF